MAVTPKDIEEQIETRLIALLNAEAFISTDSIPVRAWQDLDTEIGKQQVIVHANKVLPTILDENGETGEWSVRVDLLSYVHNAESEIPESQTDSLYQFLLGFAGEVTKAQIQSGLSGLTINGKNTLESGEDLDERFFQKMASIQLFVQ